VYPSRKTDDRRFCAVFEDEFFVTVGAEVDEWSGMAFKLTARYHVTPETCGAKHEIDEGPIVDGGKSVFASVSIPINRRLELLPLTVLIRVASMIHG